MIKNKKPYYLRQPWDILFKKGKMEKVSPWSVDLVFLLATLLEEMEKAGIDLRIAGTAVSSSVLIYEKKAELLLEIDKPILDEDEKPDVYIPPPVMLPYRFELTTTSVIDLIEALEKALSESSVKKSSRLPILPDPDPDFLHFENYLLQIEADAEGLLSNIKSSYLGKTLTFLELVKELPWKQIVKIFMMLLFLAQRLDVRVFQDENEDDILIDLNEGELYE